MPFSYLRTVHLADTDAAGVVFFPNYLVMCHEAYEEALAAAGIDLNNFFAGNGLIVPIAKSEADYLRPLLCGEKLRITAQPSSLSENSFEVRYEIFKAGRPEKIAARIRTVHVCISSAKRERSALPTPLAAWVRGG